MSKVYSPIYFKKQLPEWKRKKDPILSRIFYRPVSFLLASLCANNGINANTVSYFSGIVAIVACFFFILEGHYWHIIGAILINIWLLLDCTDGNLARSYKKQPFGEFADGISSYILVGLMGTAMGITVYFEGGIIVGVNNPWIILVGALASSADTLMRLIYHKYKATERELAEIGVLEIEKDMRLDHNQVGNIRIRIESELGVGGMLPIAILVATICHALDIIVIYCFLYYGLSCLFSLVYFVRKAIIASKMYRM